MTNVQVYDVALPADFIAENYKLSGLDELGKDYPYWDNLIGYWPCDREEDYEGEVLPDLFPIWFHLWWTECREIGYDTFFQCFVATGHVGRDQCQTAL